MRIWFYLSPAPVGRLSTQPPARRAYAPEGDLRENVYIWSDSLIPLKGGTGRTNQTNHQSLTGPMV
jgi:hypothetical protein